MFTTTEIRRASRELQVRLDAVREKELLHQWIAGLVWLVVVCCVVWAYMYELRPHPLTAPEWLPPFEIGAFMLLVIVSLIGGEALYMQMCRRFSKRARGEYDALCMLLAQEPYRSIAVHVRRGKFRYRKDHWDDPRNLEYGGILARA